MMKIFERKNLWKIGFWTMCASCMIMFVQIGVMSKNTKKQIERDKTEYSKLQDEYSALLNEAETSSSKYNDLADRYDRMQREYEDLSSDYEELGDNLTDMYNGVKTYELSWVHNDVRYRYSVKAHKLFGSEISRSTIEIN